MYEEVRTEMQTVKVQDTLGLNQILGEDGGQAWHQTRPRCSGSGSDLEIAGPSIDELPRFRELLQRDHQGLCGQGIPDATTNEAQRQEVHVEQRGGRVIPENKEKVVQGTGARDANGKRDVRAGHGCVGSSNLWHSLSRTGMEREDSLETDSVREISLE